MKRQQSNEIRQSQMKKEKVAILSLSLHNSPCIFRVAKIKENVKK